MFKPVYNFLDLKPSILLKQGQARIIIDGKEYYGDCDVCLDLIPSANIRFYGHFKSVPAPDAMNIMFGNKMISAFFFNGIKIDGFKLNIGGKADTQEMTLKWAPNSEPIIGVGDDSTSMNRVIFHLFNFVDLIANRSSIEQIDDTLNRIEHVDLIHSGWKIEIKSLPETKENIKSLNNDGGFRLTHIGCIEKIDGSNFSGKFASECLKAMRFFLSFSKGGWCEPVCSVGFDSSSNRVWEQWTSPREPWHYFQSWFDPHHCEQITDLFPKFMQKWNIDKWRDALTEVIYWYLNANGSLHGIDAGIILSQTALERLSYQYSVEDKLLITSNGFKILWASDKLRLLFSSLKIPIKIPNETPELQKLSQSKWQDSPHALTEIRNSLVHPEYKNRVQFNAAYYEVWNLSLWYLEMAILATCEYSGKYGSRLKNRYVGQVENVPWV